MPPLTWFTLLSFILTTIAAALLAAAIFAKRIISSRTPRCPNCKYPLTSIPHTHDDLPLCPECGREATSLIELHTLTKRKRLIPIALLLFIAALAAHLTPTIKSQGWYAALPMSLQINYWSTGDDQLRARIYSVHRDDKLTEPQRRALAQQIIEHYTTNPNPHSYQIGTYARATTKPPLLTEDHFATLLTHTINDGMKQFIILTALSRHTPTTENLAQARRNLAWNPDTKTTQRTAIRWLIEAPALPDDAPLIRSAITETSDTAFWEFHSHFDRAPQELIAEVLPLLDDPDPTVRTRVLLILDEWRREIRDHPDIEPQIATHLVTLINDPNQRIQREATALIEDLTPISVPQLHQIITTPTDPVIFNDILFRIRRLKIYPPEILPDLEAVILDDARPLTTRLQTANAYEYIKARARVSRPIGLTNPVYDDLIRALESNDLETFTAFNTILNDDSPPQPDLHFTEALRRRLNTLNTETQTYLDTHPFIAAALETWRPSMKLPDSAPTSQILDTLAPTVSP